MADFHTIVFETCKSYATKINAKYYHTLSSSQLDDCVQDAFIKVFENFDPERDNQSHYILRAYISRTMLSTMAEYASIDHSTGLKKKRTNRKELDNTIVNSHYTLDSQGIRYGYARTGNSTEAMASEISSDESDENYKRIKNTLKAELNAKDYTAIECLENEFSTIEITKVFGCSISGAGSRICRARQRAQTCINRKRV